MDDLILNAEQKTFLLNLARDTIKAWLSERKRPDPQVDDPILQTACGAFVTLNTKSGDLRGCIGHVVAKTPLYRTVIDCAISAACQDPRFPPLKLEELDDVTIEISALSPLREIGSPGDIEVGKHGLMITKGFFKGLLLPQVGERYKWDAETFMEHTCMKAGLPGDAWRSGATIEVFSALVFGEKD
ncbi:AmmeMemoRadiSam system protein A [Acidobacteriota bacterium]